MENINNFGLLISVIANLTSRAILSSGVGPDQRYIFYIS